MQATQYLRPMDIIAPLSQNIMTLAIVASMTTIMTSAMATTSSLAAVSTMGKMSALSTTGAMGAGAMGSYEGYVSPQQELAAISKKIFRLSFPLNDAKEAVASHRKRRNEVMRNYHLVVIPAINEMKKYPPLRQLQLELNGAESELDKLETRMTLLQVRKKQLEVSLGARAAEPDLPAHFTASNKRSTPLIKDIYHGRS